jgi:hypothetical protein
MKETDKKIGELGNRFGELAEHLVAPSIHRKFRELGFTFEQVSQNHEIEDAQGNGIIVSKTFYAYWIYFSRTHGSFQPEYTSGGIGEFHDVKSGIVNKTVSPGGIFAQTPRIITNDIKLEAA